MPRALDVCLPPHQETGLRYLFPASVSLQCQGLLLQAGFSVSLSPRDASWESDTSATTASNPRALQLKVLLSPPGLIVTIHQSATVLGPTSRTPMLWPGPVYGCGRRGATPATAALTLSRAMGMPLLCPSLQSLCTRKHLQIDSTEQGTLQAGALTLSTFFRAQLVGSTFSGRTLTSSRVVTELGESHIL